MQVSCDEKHSNVYRKDFNTTILCPQIASTTERLPFYLNKPSQYKNGNQV